MNVKFNWIRHLLLDVRYSALALLFLSCLSPHASAIDLFEHDSSDETDAVVLEVAEPFIDMHTGPGRGYPIFNVVEQGETIQILKRKTNWYKIRSEDSKTGWANATQLAHTLKPTGVPVDLPEVSHGDYLKSRWRVGFTAGQLDGASTFSMTAGFRPFSWTEVEVEGGKIFDESVTSDYYGINLLVEPMPDWVITPYVSVGGGMFSFNNRQKVVVDDAGSPSYASLGAGASYYVVSNLVVRGGYRSYSISTDEDRVWLNAWTIGLNVFF
jgi:opacity protein-like surface antigen